MKQSKGPFPHGKIVDMTGWRFGRLLIIRQSGNTPTGQPIWQAKCDCGNTHEATSGNLRNGGTRSCGCLYRETRDQSNYVHGLSTHPLYNIWRNMHKRCYYPGFYNYDRYGGAGVGVTEEWHGPFGLIQFVKDMVERPDAHYLALIDPEQDYSPANCEWVPAKIIHRTRRRNNRMVTWDGKTQSVAQWADDLGINEALLRYRLNFWDVERAMTEEVKAQAPSRLNEPITWDGKTQSVKEWATEIGMSARGLEYRLRRWDLERAMTTPPTKSGRKPGE